MTHRIRQHSIHVDLNGTEADGLALQSRLPALCYDTLLPVLERVLDRYAPANEHLSIDRLEINAGTLTLARFDTDLAKAIAESLDRALREQVARVDSSVSDKGQRRTEQQSVETALFYFLKTGRLPWSFRLPPGRSLEQTVLDYWREAPDSVGGFRAINDAMRRVLASATARQRLMGQFSPVFWQVVLARLWPEGRDRIEAVLSTLRGSGEEPSDSQFGAVLGDFERQLWESVLAHLTTGGTPTETELVGETWQRLPAPARQHPALASRLARHWPGVTDHVLASPLPIKQLDFPRPELGESPMPTPETDKDESDGAAGIYIDNAGLILLHPFLSRFFDTLGIAGENRLLQPDRALGLLHFLATGQPTAPEHELTLPKVLCNVPLATPTEREVALTETETDEAESLLRAIIRHWEVLRNTSPDGLRGTFLLRPGKLSLRPDGNWLLQVEPSSYDILLDQLPWGISMIQLPWMARMLWVEWR